MFFLGNECTGQFYRPFPETDAVWTLLSIHYTAPFPSNSDEYYGSYIIQLGDTNINANTYHKLYRYPFADDSVLPYIFADTGYLGGIRQDTAARKVYVYFRNDSIERLLYDFSVTTIGSPFPNTVQKPQDSAYLEVLDTIHLACGDSSLSFGYAPGQWLDQFQPTIIEGVGSVVGGLLEIDSFFIAPGTNDVYLEEEIKCLNTGDTLVWFKGPIPVDSTCVTLLTASVTRLAYYDSHVRVTPNPANDFIYITYSDLPEEHDYYFTVYNILGQPIANQPLAPASTNIPCANWQSGIYLWQVSDESGFKITEGKVVKE